MNKQIVGVVGAGVMGIGVTHCLAQAGHRVLLLDLENSILKHAKEEIMSNLRMQRMFHKAADQESIEHIIERITFTTDYTPFGDADFVIENVIENWDVKKEVHTRLDSVCPPHTVFAANTSAISIT